MKVTLGKSVKNIPKQFVDGVFILEESQLEAPSKIRLTPFERFLFAEAAWRTKLEKLVAEYINGLVPTHATVQHNREGSKRYVVYYDSDNDISAMVIVPKSLYNKCPIELRRKEFFEW